MELTRIPQLGKYTGPPWEIYIPTCYVTGRFSNTWYRKRKLVDLNPNDWIICGPRSEHYIKGKNKEGLITFLPLNSIIDGTIPRRAIFWKVGVWIWPATEDELIEEIEL